MTPPKPLSMTTGILPAGQRFGSQHRYGHFGHPSADSLAVHDAVEKFEAHLPAGTITARLFSLPSDATAVAAIRVYVRHRWYTAPRCWRSRAFAPVPVGHLGLRNQGL